ncbi:phosphoribosylanthranilate isomerase [Siccirubricoccus sp. G192]|uniref:phosphoribosylanthranilate isomerase n=1 Tax=Siccirubricoccus sp. G192 TaxID=2849651 RepID=UPI001C2B7AFE|nr:phosphoribosylanthranilate isomerase [Siccirubricoccus sp. G192]MBV1796171.1 phosphoribosylanthranilate isomerase [Siccirubricoccus sp. G192]
MVTHLLDAGAIAGLADAIGVRAVQVQDDLPVDQMRQLARLLPGRRLIKAIHVTGPEAMRHARAYQGVAQALLLDSRTPERLGGTGRTHDWSISRAIAQSVAPLPLYLAGGLRPGNVEAAIRAVRPSGVDVNSGVETADGAKDPSAMRAFLGKARAALSALPPVTP